MSVGIYGIRLPENGRLHKVLVAARMAGIKVDFIDFEFGKDNEAPDYLRNCHPLGRTPVLQTDEGYLFESNAILRHIARMDRTNSNLYGRTAFESSQVDAWIDFSTTEISDCCAHFFYTNCFGKPSDEATDKQNVDTICTGFDAIDRWMETRTFLVGERMTIADISIAFTMQLAIRWAPNAEELLKKFKNATRLYNTVMNQPKTVEVLKEEGASFGPRPKAKAAPEPKPKAEAKPKKEEAEEEDEAPVEKKKPNPLDSLPPTTFNLDEFKREYSNKDTRKEAAPYFFQNYDAEGWTAYKCVYKYNEDNKMQFMTANLTRGWFQRMEHLRKYGFGIALIVGEPNAHDIVGFFFWRGKGMPECVNEVEDTCLFDWSEIKDVKGAAEEITDYLCWDGKTFTEGMKKPVLEGRCFK
jgi:elongation factor 1-gamma